MAKFTAQTEKEIVQESLIPAKTICDIEVVEAEDEISKSSGNDMIKLKLKVFHNNKESTLVDYIVFSEANGSKFKLRRSCDAFGILDAYNKGEVSASDYRGKSGRAKIGIQEDKTGMYRDKNAIAEYLSRPTDVKLDDEVPF